MHLCTSGFQPVAEIPRIICAIGQLLEKLAEQKRVSRVMGLKIQGDPTGEAAEYEGGVVEEGVKIRVSRAADDVEELPFVYSEQPLLYYSYLDLPGYPPVTQITDIKSWSGKTQDKNYQIDLINHEYREQRRLLIRDIMYKERSYEEQQQAEQDSNDLEGRKNQEVVDSTAQAIQDRADCLEKADMDCVEGTHTHTYTHTHTCTHAHIHTLIFPTHTHTHTRTLLDCQEAGAKRKKRRTCGVGNGDKTSTEPRGRSRRRGNFTFLYTIILN
jgi:hypothetical protein